MMRRLLQFPFENLARAQSEISSLARDLPESAWSRLDMLLATSPAPERGLQSFMRLREQQPAAFERLVLEPSGLRYLAAIFTHSHFLTEVVLEHPAWMEELVASGISGVIPREELPQRLEGYLPQGLPDPLDLAKFRRRHLLRIAIRDILGIAGLPEITTELSELADTLIEAAYERIRQELVRRHGTPLDPGGRQVHFAVIALGKLGGMELNYSSDIDLMFLYSAAGETSGPIRIVNDEFFKIAATQLTTMLSQYTAEGLCYRVDLRLRPEGAIGEVCISLEGARHYYAERARDWELQMLIKARVAAGHVPTGQALLDSVQPRIYSSTLDFSAVEQLSLTRDRLNEKLTNRQMRRGIAKLRDRTHAIDVKLERGGIRDIEFLVQCLQRLYGGADLWVRHGGTMLALARLQDKGLLSDAEYGNLASAYQFLRNLEHRLQLEDDRQTHTLPREEAELDLVARRMPSSGGSAQWLIGELRGHLEVVSEIYDRVVRSRSTPGDGTDIQASGRQTPMVVLALEQRAPKVAEALSKARQETLLGQRGSDSFEHFLERLAGDPARLERLNTRPEVAGWALDLFEHSPFFADELIRTPQLADDLARGPGEEPAPHDLEGLRRWYRREMLRIQAESICRSHPIFETLERTSGLADQVLERVYDVAVREAAADSPPQNPAYPPANQMRVIALGRLGMHEFDLGSDADLVFVIPDSDADELAFWTRVAERLVAHITAYTGLGVLFAVDTRLRPNGNAGPLVATEGTFRDYFDRSAEAWEGITYMKSRAVAGDAAGAEDFLHQLQVADWKTYGLGGRSRSDLRQMRMRLEKEQGSSHPLKAGRGGYYDIDFLLMYLRLKSAGIYFRVLNTPERVSVLESMGLLDHANAEFLLVAATFYRAVDHGIRVLSGHAEGRLPKPEAQREALAALVARWSPVPLSKFPELAAETRALFDKTFA
jgi:glutamate-ammonia-ligase adenylyltransferase